MKDSLNGIFEKSKEGRKKKKKKKKKKQQLVQKRATGRGILEETTSFGELEHGCDIKPTMVGDGIVIALGSQSILRSLSPPAEAKVVNSSTTSRSRSLSMIAGFLVSASIALIVAVLEL
ncbi:hypothetical protein RFI_15905 [Reticulomyxa filosa]|uniref:Uncharacterized protein n=1 Tax=Reticulomyxa filosa TaxID=46433 RepID=X6N5U2_RETFI|nr:hypothetical protein RFI_15905 [Reticulomyxa filosa]|eukprot:ETO21298.1 hypothetical protein RFI_15905 [Reticulomyxa filosa]